MSRNMSYENHIFIVLCLFWIASAIIICETSLVEHEEVHQTISTYFGCKNSSIHINYFTFHGGQNCLDANYTYNEEEYKLHAMNEIVGYNVNSIIYAIILCSFLIGMVIVSTSKND
jgi:hypothetical protein